MGCATAVAGFGGVRAVDNQLLAPDDAYYALDYDNNDVAWKALCTGNLSHLKDDALQPGYAGIRPKIVPPGAPAQDFIVQGPAEHGVPGLIHLFGIESPGLTASLALAEKVRALAGNG